MKIYKKYSVANLRLMGFHLNYVEVLLLLFLFSNSAAQTHQISDGGTVSTCYGTFYDSGGSGGNYGSDEDYTITFCSDDESAVVAVFTNMDLDWNDYLYIYDGPDDTSPILAIISRYSSAGSYTSSGECLTFNFQSNASGEKGGFTANISCTAIVQNFLISDEGTVTTCSGNFYDSGGQGGEHSDNEDYEMTFCSDDGNAVVIDFSNLELGLGDTLFIYDGQDASSPLLASLSGNLSSRIYISSATCLTVRFISDGSLTGAGFASKISCTPIVTEYLISDEGTVTTCSGNFRDSGGQGGVYTDNEDYEITFCPGNEEAVVVDFLSLDIDSEDNLYVYDGPNISSPLVSTLSDLSTARNYISSGTCLTFKFVSNGSLVGDGFAARISCTPIVQSYLISDGETVSACSGRLYDSGGQFDNYSNNEDYTRSICSEDGRGIRVDFSAFDIGSSDFLYIYDGPNTSSPLLTTVTDNSTAPPSFTSSGTCLTYRFTSNSHNTGTGFVASFNCTSVIDIVDPTAICQDITIILDETGNAIITAEDVNNGSTDNFTEPQDLILAIDKSNFNCNDLGNNTVILTVTDEVGLRETCTSTVTVNEIIGETSSKLSIELGNDTTICEGETITIMPVGEYQKIIWNDGSTSFPYETASEGLISCIISNGAYCSLEDELYLTVNVNPHVEIGNDTSFCGYLTLDAGMDGIRYSWSTGESTQQIEIQSGMQIIQVEVENEYGCVERDTISIEMCNMNDLFSDIPNTITPNYDGKNDTWIIDKLVGFPDVVVEIYDRWGRLIYISETGYLTPWEGTNMNGKLVPAGSYTYVFMLNYVNYERVMGVVLVII